ncbi:MAG: class I SAM-dependent methyltransferase [Candidatus Limnocylindrales bacterium]
MSAPSVDIAEYDLRYRDIFWASRDYEDRCDRIAIRALLPPAGERLVEVGAGFGRLAGLYAGYRSVVLFDASEQLLQAARERLGGDPRVEFVLGDAYELPFADASFDTLVCVRVMHNFADPGAALREFARVLRPGGSLVLEFANKRHLKAIARWALRRQCWSPFSEQEHEYLPLHFDRSPRHIRRLLVAAGFTVGPQRAVSLFRLGALTEHVPLRLLAGLERRLQSPLGGLAIGPSVYLRATRT